MISIDFDTRTLAKDIFFGMVSFLLHLPLIFLAVILFIPLRLYAELRQPNQVLYRGPDVRYLRRWWIRRNGKWFVPASDDEDLDSNINSRFNIYLHQMLASDDGNAPHDHPWHFVSLLLWGSYIEMSPWRPGKLYTMGMLNISRAEGMHWLKYVAGGSWSLVITGKKFKPWGFLCKDKKGKGYRWVHWKDYTDARDSGKVGDGCGEFE